MIYQMSDSSIELEGDWVDRSMNVLITATPPTDTVNMVVSRDSLRVDMTFAEHIKDVRDSFRANLPQFRILMDDSGVHDERPSHFFEFQWNKEGTLVHQAVLIILNDSLLVTLTTTAMQVMDTQTRQKSFNIMRSFKFKSPMKKPAAGAV